MLQIHRLLIIFSALTVVAVLAGCGLNTTTNATGLSTTTAEPSSTAATKASPMTTSSSISAVRTGPVTLHVGAQFYRTGDTISVTLSNQSNQTIYFPDHLTNCTVILLQRQKVQSVVAANGQAVSGSRKWASHHRCLQACNCYADALAGCRTAPRCETRCPA